MDVCGCLWMFVACVACFCGISDHHNYLKAYAWQPGAGQATTFGLWCGKIGPRFSAQTQEGLCWTEAGIMRSACLYGSSLGLCWAQVVPILGLCWPSRAHVEPCWAHFGPILTQVGPMLGYVDPCWARLGAMLEPGLGHLCWNALTMRIFPPRAPFWSPKPGKNRGFATSPRWISLLPKGPKHRKKRCFFLTCF